MTTWRLLQIYVYIAPPVVISHVTGLIGIQWSDVATLGLYCELVPGYWLVSCINKSNKYENMKQ